ncbi:MAG: putative 2OG-Fe(II) oxygenase, partial [Sphingobium sp.]
ALMLAALAARPGWVEGQTYLATLRRLAGGPARDDRGFAEAVAVEPGNPALRLGWFHWLAKCRDWAAAAEVLAQARQAFGDLPALAAAALYLASESSDAYDPALFDAVEDKGDPGLDLARVRHALRGGAAERAAGIAQRHLGGQAARLFWPYMAVAWRLTGDPRAAWLDRPDTFIRAMDIGLDRSELAELADLLRTLHGAAAPYPDQSVRGGTQTDRPLLFRHEPIVQRTREAIEAAVRSYVAQLPPAEEGHPLLGTPRAELRFAGSWSVRLRAQGYHACHSHPAGWISSALYISLPAAETMGAPPAGWLRFGTPPPELGLDLAPYGEVEPAVGRLVLFPSTLWHGTIPFADGERLSIAFDIAPPRY